MPTTTVGELYELVWSEPMRTAATRFDVSDVYLKRICKNFRVPVPPRGYWNKKRAGKATPRTPPLPSYYDPSTTIGFGNSIKPDPVDPRAKEARRQAYGALSVPEPSDTLHPSLVPYANGEADDEERSLRISDQIRQAYPKVVAERYALLSELAYALEANGFVDVAYARSNLFGRWQKMPAWIGVRVHNKQVRTPIPKNELRTYRGAPRSTYTHMPSGELLIWAQVVGGERGMHTTWRITAERRLVDILPEVITTVLALVRVTFDDRDRIIEREEAAERKKEDEATERRHKAADAAAWELFREASNRWEQAERLKRFVEAIASTDAEGIQGSLQWARERLASLDPLAAGPISFFEKLNDQAKLSTNWVA